MNFYSYCPIKFKINAIKTLIHRANHWSSSYDLFSAEINYLTTFFSNNGYPVKLFETLTGRFLNSVKCGNETQIATVPKDTMYISLPYLGQISHQLEYFLLKLLGRKYLSIYILIKLWSPWLYVCLFVCMFVCLRPCVRILDTEWLL